MLEINYTPMLLFFFFQKIIIEKKIYENDFITFHKSDLSIFYLRKQNKKDI